jgi:hypothetical protein
MPSKDSEFYGFLKSSPELEQIVNYYVDDYTPQDGKHKAVIDVMSDCLNRPGVSLTDQVSEILSGLQELRNGYLKNVEHRVYDYFLHLLARDFWAYVRRKQVGCVTGALMRMWVNVEHPKLDPEVLEDFLELQPQVDFNLPADEHILEEIEKGLRSYFERTEHPAKSVEPAQDLK